MPRGAIPSLRTIAYREAFPQMVRQAAIATTRRRTGSLQPHVRKAVKRIVDAGKEVFHKHTYSTQDVTSTVAFIQLTAISQGDGYNERLGDVVDLKSLNSRILVVRDDNATADTFDNVRIVTFIWHPDTANETPSATTDILEQATYPHLSPLARDRAVRQKFTLLDDRWVPLACREGGDPKQAYAKIFIKKKLNKNVYFNPGLTTGKNHIYHMVIGEQVAGANNSNMYYDSLVAYRQK